MIVLVPTIPKTGTHFALYELLRDLPLIKRDAAPYGKRVWHLSADAMPEIRKWAARGHPILVPLRHPVAVARSWVAWGRGNEMDLLCDYWRRLAYVLDRYQPAYVPLDAPDRDEWLARASTRLGVVLSTTWPVVASCGLTGSLTYRQDALVQNQREEAREFFARFGYERRDDEVRGLSAPRVS